LVSFSFRGHRFRPTPAPGANKRTSAPLCLLSAALRDDLVYRSLKGRADWAGGWAGGSAGTKDGQKQKG
jgi:hypothetical protein